MPERIPNNATYCGIYDFCEVFSRGYSVAIVPRRRRNPHADAYALRLRGRGFRALSDDHNPNEPGVVYNCLDDCTRYR